MPKCLPRNSKEKKKKKLRQINDDKLVELRFSELWTRLKRKRKVRHPPRFPAIRENSNLIKLLRR
jgi:hypothetical protein